MPRDPRPTRQPGAPGRKVRRPRQTRSSASPAEPVPHGATASLAEPRPLRKARRRRRETLRHIAFTRRALVLLGVLLALGFSYAGPLRILLSQQRDLATTQAEISQRTAQVNELQSQLERWEDPAYVKSQARTQLGFVLPGETGYRVVGVDGKVITDKGTGAGVAAIGPADTARWWDRLASSIQTADRPSTGKR